MNERRNPMYVFTSKKALIRYFSLLITEDRIGYTMHALQRVFVRRKQCSDYENKLQFLKKCEYELFRITKGKTQEKDEQLILTA